MRRCWHQSRRTARGPPYRFLAFFTGQIRKPETGRAYARNVGDFLNRLQRTGVALIADPFAPSYKPKMLAQERQLTRSRNSLTMQLMKRDQLITRLKSLEPSLRAHGVASLFLYGSHARDEARPGSDIDILADYEQDTPPSLSSFMETCHELQQAFPGVEIGFSTRDGLVPIYRLHIENSAIRVF